MSGPMPSASVMKRLHQGAVIPACPLALDARRRFDEVSQRALIRYYAAAGAGGLAVGVHTTQFEIRDPRIGLFQPVLELAIGELQAAQMRHRRPLVKIAGACGPTAQAVAEAELAASLGYDLVLLSLGALQQASDDELIRHCRTVAEVIPLMGFYLQPAVGGRVLSYAFWRRFVEIENVAAIKIAPFNRYYTLDVVRAVADAGVEKRVALYTGNDDNIILDLITPYEFRYGRKKHVLRIRGGLLGQWSIWTARAVEFLEQIHAGIGHGKLLRYSIWLRRNAALTDANGAVFDVAHNFRGCIAGINEVLRRQGLMTSALCLDPNAGLSPGQSEEIDRVCRSYPWLTDDDFVRHHLDEWRR